MTSKGVRVNLKMVGNTVYDDTVLFSMSERLYSVQYRIKQNHGDSLSNLQLWKNEVEPSSILRNWNATLGEIVQNNDPAAGSAIDENGVPSLVLYYDFKPPEGLCPILNAKVI